VQEQIGLPVKDLSHSHCGAIWWYFSIKRYE